ncbi:MAG TPA: HAMP domain-containing sensor histidine kinase [Thermomicrobiales bacterium]|nr:HAMP domain-containing sensor histidine kinase [Thermomicrobiales bacterium]
MLTNGKPTVRLKITLIYGVLFLVVGVLLLSTTYGLVRHELRGVGDVRSGTALNGGPASRSDVTRARKEERRAALRSFRRQSLLAMVVMTAIAIGLGWLVAGRILAPLRTITNHVRIASASTLDQRLALNGPDDELKDLADTFDGMLDRLQAAFNAQQAFAAQASHELRTPLATIRAETDLLLADFSLQADQRAAIHAIQTAAVRSDHLIEGMLALARSASTMFDQTRFDLAEIVGDVVGEAVEEASRAGVRLDLDVQTALVEGDTVLIRQMVSNLVQNAVRYNQTGGFVRVTVHDQGELARLVIENSGPHVSASEVARLFQPFARGTWAQQNRGGYGLGLAIVQSVIERHRGSIKAIPRENGGLIVTVLLPRPHSGTPLK